MAWQLAQTTARAVLVFVDYGRVEPDNNRVKRQMRIVAVGRKNFLFAGSDAGAERAAILYTIFGNCLLAGVDPLVDPVQEVRDEIRRIREEMERDLEDAAVKGFCVKTIDENELN